MSDPKDVPQPNDAPPVKPAAKAQSTIKKVAELDPEVILQKKFRAKCQFRALGRLVIANLYWLMEDEEHYEGLDDVKRRVQQAVRGKTKKKQLLTIQDKALLNKNADERSDSEKKYLYRIIGGLKCFKRYPNHVKRKLAAVTYFRYYSTNRVIVRQHQEAHALYFIMTGDVVVSHLVYDELLQKEVSVELGVMHAGDMFGEVSLLHNIPRTATCTTSGNCELLALMKEDFKNVLQASIQKSWDEVRRAMSAFTYFDGLDEVALREGCIVAKMKSYAIGETILGDGNGVPNFVYFVLSGRCQMIESLQIIVSKHVHHIYYTLYDPYVEKEESDKDFEEKYFKAYKNLGGSNIEASSSMTPSSILKYSGQNVRKSHSVTISQDNLIGETKASSRASVRMSKSSEPRSSRLSKLSQSRQSEVLVPPREEDEDRKASIRLSVDTALVHPPPKYKTFFMQVCFFNPGSSFGFGENMRDRRIVASTPVMCMLMPKIWLLQKNTANIWTRIQYYLTKKIPNKRQLFQEFVEQRRWMEFKEQMVNDVVDRHNTVNWTSKHDIPYSIRMEEMIYPDEA